jgi:hypothetical protein
VLDHALLNLPARWRFLRMQYGRGNLDAPAQTLDDAASATDVTKAIGASDHDGLVVELLDPSILIGGKSRGHDEHGHEQRGHGSH